jgi:hypothetical protein
LRAFGGFGRAREGSELFSVEAQNPERGGFGLNRVAIPAARPG